MDFDGKVFGEFFIELAIPKFRETKRISSLHVLPLEFYLSKDGIMPKLLNAFGSLYP